MWQYKTNFSRRFKQGFTLMETLLVLFLLGLVSLAAPLAWSFTEQNDLDVATVTLAQSLRRAQSLSSIGFRDVSWGVETQSRSITIFKGASFAGRDPGFDEVSALPVTFTIAGPNEIVFSKFYGLPQTTGSIMLTNPIGQSRTVNVNGGGKVAY